MRVRIIYIVTYIYFNMMTLYQKFLDLTGLVHISEADFNAALDPKTDAQKALHDFIKWSVGKTDANPDASSFRKDFNTTHEDHKADVHDSVLPSPTVPTPKEHKAVGDTETSLTAPVATHSDAETVSSSAPVAPDSNVLTNSETTVGEPSTLVVNEML
nr:MAG TPA: hypothetical protein [Caudoviricetes sp.]